MSSTPKYHGECLCESIKWTVTGKVDFPSVCHCTVCQTTSGSAFGTTSLMIYNPKGVIFQGAEPKVYKDKSERGKTTQR